MSTLAFSTMTDVRKREDPDKQGAAGKPGVSTYVDAMAALVPAEVLALHALLLSFTTETQTGEDGTVSTIITEAQTLGWSFWGLLVLSVFLYLTAQTRATLDRFDVLRALVPPVAFVLWTMLQKTTAFDPIAPDWMNDANRAAIALFGAVILGAITSWLAQKASERPTA